MSAERRTSRQEVSTKEFFVLLRGLFSISRIYYPGSGDLDNSIFGNPLSRAFKPEEIVCLDIERFSEKAGFYILGNHSQSPFRDGVFDAIFYQDNHADSTGFKEILRTLKPGGILVYSRDHCSLDVTIQEVRKTPELKKVNLPFLNSNYTVFQKRMPSSDLVGREAATS